MASSSSDYHPVNQLLGSEDEHQPLASSSTSLNPRSASRNGASSFIEALDSPPTGSSPLPHLYPSHGADGGAQHQRGGLLPYDSGPSHDVHGHGNDSQFWTDGPMSPNSTGGGSDRMAKEDYYGEEEGVPTYVSSGSSDSSVGGPRSGGKKKKVGFFGSLCTANQISFLVTVLAQALTVIAMIAVVFVEIEKQTKVDNAKLQSIDVYLAIYGFAGVFEMLVAIDALRLKSTIQLTGILCFTAAMITYSALMPGQIDAALQPTMEGENCGSDPNLTCFGIMGLYQFIYRFILVIPIVLAVSLLILSVLTWRLYKEFGWTLYKKLGADLKIKKMYRNYQILTCFLKFDFFFFTGFSVQFLILVLRQWTGIVTQRWEFALTIAAIPFTLVVLILAAVALNYEIRWLMGFVMLSELGGMVYFGYKIAIMWMPGPQMDRYVVARKSLTVFSSISLAALILTFIMTIVCCMAFGKGLKDAMKRSRNGGIEKRGRLSYKGEKAEAGEKFDGSLPHDEERLALD